MTAVLGPPTILPSRAADWARSRNAATWFPDLAELYWAIAPLAGVRPEVVFAQAARETGFGKFGRAVTREHHNFCGLKVHDSNSLPDDAADTHFRFPTDEVGVKAHVDHTALYAGAPGYPISATKIIVAGRAVGYMGTPDPRHFPHIRGTASTVEAMGGKWAPSLSYGYELVSGYMNPMMGV